MDQDTIIERIHQASQDNKLSCEKAHDLAHELNVPLKMIGALCDELKIRIRDCQLGCF